MLIHKHTLILLERSEENCHTNANFQKYNHFYNNVEQNSISEYTTPRSLGDWAAIAEDKIAFVATVGTSSLKLESLQLKNNLAMFY